WRPNALMIAESELWPTLIDAARRRGVPILLVNARMSERSHRRWRRVPSAIGALLSRLDLVLARTAADAQRFADLGAPRVAVAGNLKYDGAAPPADAAELADLSARIGGRPVWAAASTHDGEEAIALGVHRALAARFPDLLTIVAPRHPERGEAVAAQARAAGFRLSRRAAGEPVGPDVDVYLVDTIGDLGLVYRLASVAFLGKSLAGDGGQNPIEAAKLGCAVLHGPHVANFAEDFAMLDAARGALETPDPEALAVALARLLGDPARLRAMGRAASEAVEREGGATQAILRALGPALAGDDAGA
ncbi:MAG: 3-deoxy-D-manno-octulosonic acid transferase, partial [Methylobacteriaceae bacterium]|nr:3-deoxy-D-manno-octulosonic acid transferase [Methylobacteriaceae bacterium]